jgi:hypothetical protein
LFDFDDSAELPQSLAARVFGLRAPEEILLRFFLQVETEFLVEFALDQAFAQERPQPKT